MSFEYNNERNPKCNPEFIEFPNGVEVDNGSFTYKKIPNYYFTEIECPDEETTFKKYYQDLWGEKLPNILHYEPWSKFALDIGIEMYHACANDGKPGLKAYMAKLRKRKEPEYKQVVQLLLGDTSEIDNYAGTLLSNVQPQPLPWLWYPRLALGKITTLDGDPGLGKSLIGADIGARVTKGEKMPDGTPCIVRGGVVVIMPEDTLQDTIQPRFARAGADLSKVVDLSTVKTDDGEETIRQANKMIRSVIQSCKKLLDCST